MPRVSRRASDYIAAILVLAAATAWFLREPVFIPQTSQTKDGVIILQSVQSGAVHVDPIESLPRRWLARVPAGVLETVGIRSPRSVRASDSDTNGLVTFWFSMPTNLPALAGGAFPDRFVVQIVGDEFNAIGAAYPRGPLVERDGMATVVFGGAPVVPASQWMRVFLRGSRTTSLPALAEFRVKNPAWKRGGGTSP